MAVNCDSAELSVTESASSGDYRMTIVVDGESEEVTATVANVGPESGNYTAALTENNQTLKSKTIGPIAGGETATVSFSISCDNQNTAVDIGRADHRNARVEAASL
ncbi:hypothetical protein C9J85_04940 [Haloferax sp. wsp5]|nr:hypothetical protein C9J85_04940 [Haloferax sp. wsp5]